MEQLDVFNCSNVLIASYFTDDHKKTYGVAPSW